MAATNASTISILKSLRQKPLAMLELQYKIQQDVDQGVLVSLDHFLQNLEVVDKGITRENVAWLIIPAALLLVINPNSESSKVCLCVDPLWPRKSSAQSLNDYFLLPILHVPLIQTNLLISHFFVSSVIGNISNFYMQHHLYLEDALLSAVYLRAPEANSVYPTLNPESNTPLAIYLYTVTKFVFWDSGGLSCLAKSELAALFGELYSQFVHKLSDTDFTLLSKILKNSYIDDLHIGITIEYIHSEITKPTFIHKPDFNTLSLIQLAEPGVIVKALKILQVINFSKLVIILRNITELSNFLNEDRFNKAQLVALFNSVYCPQAILYAIYNSVARLTQRYIHDNFPMKTVSEKVNMESYPFIIQLACLFF